MNGKKIRELRTLCGWSQLDLEQASGISRYRISLAENNHSPLMIREYQAVEKLLLRAIQANFRKISIAAGKFAAV